jgi:hypothetical protein
MRLAGQAFCVFLILFGYTVGAAWKASVSPPWMSRPADKKVQCGTSTPALLQSRTSDSVKAVDAGCCTK